MNKPEVDIIVPVYNYGRFLDGCLQSVADQTFGNFSVIVIDNASTDDTEEIATAWCARDQRIRYVRNDSNIGSSKSCIKAYRMGAAPYAMFLAADDQLLPTFLEKTAHGLDANPDCSFAYSLCSRLVDERPVFGQNLFLPLLPTGPHNILNYLAFTNWIYPSFSLVRRAAQGKSGVFDIYETAKPEMLLQGLGDHFMWVNLSKTGNAYVVNERLGRYRIHGDSETSKFRKGRRDIVELTFLNDYIFRYETDFGLVPRLLSKANSMGRLATNFGVVRMALEMAHSDKFREVVEPVKREFLEALRQVLSDFRYDVAESDPMGSRKMDSIEHIRLLDEYLAAGDPAILKRFD
ncbi:MAG: glycosyltransferase family 2 protein [Nitrosomonadales bacterium]|nr:glycosyltransferase family 2 protein [Nitrosomonadales bacterium]